MPAGQPFTRLCRALAQPRHLGRVDLHVHTTCSDGAYTPPQIVDLARRCGLSAVAITDHDTLAGVEPAQRAALDSTSTMGGSWVARPEQDAKGVGSNARPSRTQGVPPGLEVIAGVEITADHQGAELHILGYFVRLDDSPLRHALARMQGRRVERFREMVKRLGEIGVALDPASLGAWEQHPSLGRRHVAQLLVKNRKVANIREAFQRYLGDRGRIIAPKIRLPAAEALALVRESGGVAAWAHPDYHATKARLAELRSLGLQALEVDFPGCSAGRENELRSWARELGFAVTGGSDCHGPDVPARGLGTCSVTAEELEQLWACVTFSERSSRDWRRRAVSSAASPTCSG